MQGEIDMVAPISPELHKRKLAETLPRVSLTFGTLTLLQSTVPCSSDTWEHDQVWVESVRYLYR